MAIVVAVIFAAAFLAGAAVAYASEREDGTSPFWALVITLGAAPIAAPIYLLIGFAVIPAWIAARFE
jgi:hypothetical protein